MGRVYQEFYCRGCGGFIALALNDRLTDYVVMFNCPKCGRQHDRSVKNGQLEEAGRSKSAVKEELYPTIGAWSESPRSKSMATAQKKMGKGPNPLGWRPGDAAVMRTVEDLNAKAAKDADAETRRQSWFERFAGRLIGDVDS